MENECFENLSEGSRELMTIKSIYNQLPLKDIKLVHMSDNDPIREIVERFKGITSGGNRK